MRARTRGSSLVKILKLFLHLGFYIKCHLKVTLVRGGRKTKMLREVYELDLECIFITKRNACKS